MMITYIAGPLIGAAIGYCTNYIAVKMLFYPKREIRLFGHRLPLTPGAIPKGKARLAGAIGRIVGGQLLTTEDITGRLLTEKMETKVTEMVSGLLETNIRQGIISLTDMNEDDYQLTKHRLSNAICDRIVDSLTDARIGDIFVDKLGDTIREKTRGTMLEMFVSPELIQAIAAPTGEAIQKYIENEGRDYVRPVVYREADKLENTSAADFMGKVGMSPEQQAGIIRSVYRKAVGAGVRGMMDNLDISRMIEDKVNAMNIDELESLVMSIMKKELNMIVNLGALIGLLLGILNIFI